jgi:hypothetical protein
MNISFSTLDEKMDAIYFLLALVGVGFIIFRKRRKILDYFRRFLLQRPCIIYRAQEKFYSVKTSSVPQTITGGLGVLPAIFQLIWFHFGVSSSDGKLRDLVWSSAGTVDLILTSCLLWLLFTNTYWVNHHLEGRAEWLPDRKSLRPYFIFWLIISALANFFNEPVYYFNSSVALSRLWVIVLDPFFILLMVILGVEMVEKWKFDQTSEPKVCIAEMENVEMVQLWVSQLEEANIPFHVEGLRYRQITQFFAPYLKMRLFVGERNAEETANIIHLGEVQQI